jgi:hypothetical protein
MNSPFPGMDPYLEHPSLWPDVHNSLIAAIRDELSPKVAPRYYVGLERRAYLIQPDDIVFVGRPDLSLATKKPAKPRPELVLAVAEAPAVYQVEMIGAEEVEESYLEIREVGTGTLVTVMELLSPANKISEEGRRQYMEKRRTITRSRTNLVEIDLLRDGRPLEVIGPEIRSDYRILVAPGWRRPRAEVHAFSLRQPIPEIAVPLLPGEEQPILPLNQVFHALYRRARFDLRLDYSQPPVPPLDEADAVWAASLGHPA